MTIVPLSDRPLDPTRTALVMIECQNEWLAPDGKLQVVIADRPAFDTAVDGARSLLASARDAGLNIAHVGLRFSPDYGELGQGGFGLRAAIRHHRTFAHGTPAADFARGFTPRATEFVAQGRTGASAFAGSNLDAWARHNGIDTLIFAGFALHVCVESSLRAAHDLGYAAYVASDASAAFTAAQRDHVLTHVVPHFGRAATNDALCAMFTQEAAA